MDFDLLLFRSTRFCNTSFCLQTETTTS